MKNNYYTIPQLIDANNRALRTDRRLAQIGTVLGAVTTLMGLIAISTGVITLAADLVATLAHISAIGITQ